jgi:hypothetical protein
MAELNLRNKEIISQLEYIKSEVLKTNILTDRSMIENYRAFSPDNALTDGLKYMDHVYLQKHMNDPDHKGFPVEHYSLPVYNIPDDRLKEVTKYTANDFISNLGANSDAVFLYYPPGGFVGWHTNQNNSGWQFIFSWSEQGNGFFQYYDKKKKAIVQIPDKAGWQCRHYHFGKDEPDHCWHSAYTNVPRITVCVLFRWWDKPHMKEQILAMKDQLIEEIESED